MLEMGSQDQIDEGSDAGETEWKAWSFQHFIFQQVKNVGYVTHTPNRSSIDIWTTEYRKDSSGLDLHSYCGGGIETINHLSRGLAS